MTEPHTSGLIVALPADDDPINQHTPGQDPNPHITMCWFGEADEIDLETKAAIRSAVEAISSIMDPFDAKVSGNATLGDESAKVLLIESPELVNLRDLLTTINPIGLAMSKTEQFPSWQPHITLYYENSDTGTTDRADDAAFGVDATAGGRVSDLSAHTISAAPGYHDQAGRQITSGSGHTSDHGRHVGSDDSGDRGRASSLRSQTLSGTDTPGRDDGGRSLTTARGTTAAGDVQRASNPLHQVEQARVGDVRGVSSGSYSTLPPEESGKNTRISGLGSWSGSVEKIPQEVGADAGSEGQGGAVSTRPAGTAQDLLNLRSVRIGKLALWMAGEHEEFPFGNPELDALSAAAAEPDPVLTPDNSDVAPLYLALTDAVDKEAVLDVLALVPASSTSSQPIVYSRADGVWQLDEEMRTAMLSTNPPPIVRLDAATAKNVIGQVDSYFTRKGAENAGRSGGSGGNPKDGKPGKDGKDGNPGKPGSAAVDVYDELQVYSEFGDLFLVPTLDAMYAAGGLDQNRGGAEKLRRYWTTGPGGAKIRWGTGGDWSRCVSHLSKYLGPRAKGYCLGSETEFLTYNGVMTLGDAAGTTQLVLTDDVGAPTSRAGRWVEAEISSFGEQPLLSVTLRRGPQVKIIRATPGHRWVASKRGRRLSSQVMTTAQLRPGMVLGALAPRPALIVPSQLGVAAGVMFGDGSRNGLSNHARVDLWGPKQELALYFNGICSSVRPNPTKLASGVDGVRVYGVPATLKQDPPADSTLEYLAGWLAGYIATDGNVAPSTVSISSSQRAHLELVRAVATRLGIVTYPIGTQMRRGYGAAETAIYVVRFARATMDTALFVRHDQRAAFVLSTSDVMSWRWRVESVTDHGDVEEVFCATVPGTESFALVDNIWSLNCQLRHKEATGMYTSKHAKMIRHGKSNALAASGAQLKAINAALMRAFVASGNALDDVQVTDVAPPGAPEHGARFSIPLVVPEGVETGDGRRFAPLSLTTRELPLPLLWQVRTADGHDGSVVVGRIDTIERIENGLGNATGVFDVGPYGHEVERLVRGKFLRGISADLDKFEATAEEGELGEDGEPDPKKIGSSKMLIDKARVSAVTCVARPAFEECIIVLIEDDVTPIVTDQGVS